MKEQRNMPTELRRATLFMVTPTASDGSVHTPQSLIRENQVLQTERFISVLKQSVGTLFSVKTSYYRVTNTNYIKVYLDGSVNQAANLPPFCLMIALSGFSDIAISSSEDTYSFLTINVVDCVDAHWLIELIKSELRGENENVAA